MKTKTIGIWGVYFEVDYEFIKGDSATRDYPGSDDEYVIHAIYIGSEDVTEHLSETVNTLILEKLCE